MKEGSIEDAPLDVRECFGAFVSMGLTSAKLVTSEVMVVVAALGLGGERHVGGPHHPRRAIAQELEDGGVHFRCTFTRSHRALNTFITRKRGSTRPCFHLH